MLRNRMQAALWVEGGWGGGRGLVSRVDRGAIDPPHHIAPAPFTEAITSPADWCVDNWAVTGVFMFLPELAPDCSNCIVFYFNAIYNKGHPDVYLCQYSARTAVRETERRWLPHGGPTDHEPVLAN